MSQRPICRWKFRQAEHLKPPHAQTQTQTARQGGHFPTPTTFTNQDIIRTFNDEVSFRDLAFKADAFASSQPRNSFCHLDQSFTSITVKPLLRGFIKSLSRNMVFNHGTTYMALYICTTNVKKQVLRLACGSEEKGKRRKAQVLGPFV